MLRFFSSFLGILVFAAAPGGWQPTAAAEQVRDLYRAETIITGKEEPEFSRGLRVALTDVAIKLTGDTRLVQDGRLAALLSDPQSYLETYELEDRMKGIPVHDEQGTRERPHFLRATFDPSRLDPALAELGLAKWPAERPRVLVFLGVETSASRYVLQRDAPEGYAQRAVLLATSARLGLPIFLPHAQTAAPRFEHLLATHIRPPGAEGDDAVLSGVLSLPEGASYWTMRWRLAWRGRERQWALTHVTFDTAIRDGLATTALVLSGNEPIGSPAGQIPQ